MLGEIMNIHFGINSSITCIEDVNQSFSRGRLKVMYTGKNRNGTSISRSAVEDALPTLYNVPIVCNWDYKAGTIGGHDMKVVEDEDGNVRLMNLTEPCGVVPESAIFSFSTEEDDDGNKHEYLVVDNILLWKRQDVYSHIVNDLDGKVDHSMEITVKNGCKDKTSGCYNIDSFEFTALCLLEDCEPCFQGSELSLYSIDAFKKKYSDMMRELKETFSVVESSDDDKTYIQENLTEGGVIEVEKDELLVEYGIDVSTLDFSIDDFSIEELREKFEAMKVSADDTDDGDVNDEKFELTSNINEGIHEAFASIVIDTEWGQTARYWIVDTDLDAKQIYVCDRTDWLLYGFSYTMDGDKVVVDFESKCRKKYAIVDFDGGEQASPFAETYDAMKKKLSEYSDIQKKYDDMSASVIELQSELEELRAFKSDVEFSVEHEKREQILSQFEDLAGDELFEAVKESCDEYSLESLEEKCFAIRGRKSVAKFSATVKSTKINVERTDDKKESPYGGLFEMYNKD